MKKKLWFDSETRSDRTEEFHKLLKPLGFKVFISTEQFTHPDLGQKVIDLSAMADVSTVIKRVFNYGIKVGRNQKIEELRKILEPEVD